MSFLTKKKNSKKRPCSVEEASQRASSKLKPFCKSYERKHSKNTITGLFRVLSKKGRFLGKAHCLGLNFDRHIQFFIFAFMLIDREHP
jgi:hypothetical protein